MTDAEPDIGLWPGAFAQRQMAAVTLDGAVAAGLEGLDDPAQLLEWLDALREQIREFVEQD